ncbi:unnamed protein product [Paramecium sonneborni]|uniref:Uncharacterized protein n=1 Tax=Paramecium sonneborni TaxID=65129 RepID=A0A8S1RMQ6_9CILI|nr:unnamed protein product [Paramecium sonneborni]
MGRWDIILIDDKLVGYKLIGGGSYDFNQGIKVGNWVELWENFMNHIQVTYNGEYNSKGIKTGRWDIKCYEQEQYKQIGGGWYDGDQGLKIGKWQELWHDRYYIHLHGEYNIKGKKMGRWNIESMGQNIGGGFYDSIYGNKTGRWVDIEKDFWRFKQVIYDGEYNIKGMKIGRWDTLYCQVEEKEYKLIGGGSYDSSSGVKIGSWVELWESFGYNLERTYIGEYNLQGDKVGIWVEMGLRNNQKLKETQYDN